MQSRANRACLWRRGIKATIPVPVVTRYDKLAVRFEAALTIAAISEWLPRL